MDGRCQRWLPAIRGRLCAIRVTISKPPSVMGGCECRDMSVEDACELGKRAIYHATFRDAVSGGTVSGAHVHDAWIVVVFKP